MCLRYPEELCSPGEQGLHSLWQGSRSGKEILDTSRMQGQIILCPLTWSSKGTGDESKPLRACVGVSYRPSHVRILQSSLHIVGFPAHTPGETLPFQSIWPQAFCSQQHLCPSILTLGAAGAHLAALCREQQA